MQWWENEGLGRDGDWNTWVGGVDPRSSVLSLEAKFSKKYRERLGFQ